MTGLYASPTSPSLMEAGTHVWPETILERPATPERLSWKVFICLHRFWLLYLPGWSFKLLLRKKNTSSSMKWRMKYTTILCSCQPDRHISHPWFCQLWVIAHVAEWGTPPPSVAVCKKYFVTSIQFEKSCFCIFRFRFLKNDDRRKRKRERESVLLFFMLLIAERSKIHQIFLWGWHS